MWYTLKFVGSGERERDTRRTHVSGIMNVNLLPF